MLEIAAGNTDPLVRLVKRHPRTGKHRSGKAELHSTMSSADDSFAASPSCSRQTLPSPDPHHFNSTASMSGRPRPHPATLTNSSPTPSVFPPGTEIHLRSRRTDANEAEIQVRDPGPGHPRNKLESIFERFTRSTPRSPHHGAPASDRHLPLHRRPAWRPHLAPAPSAKAQPSTSAAHPPRQQPALVPGRLRVVFTTAA